MASSLSDEARRDIADEFARWRAGIVLPEFVDQVEPGFRELALRMVRRYGPAAIEEMKRLAPDIVEGR